MTKYSPLLSLLLSASVCQAVEPVWTVEKCVGAPSHALYDPNSKTLYVSQISGEGAKKDGVGVVSRLDLDGSMLDCEWVSGLDAPKGIARQGKSLWVSDIDRMHEIDTQTGEVLHCFDVEGATFLTGVAVDLNGVVYVADLLASKIYRYRDGEFKAFASGNGLDSPAGLVVDRERLILATWGLTTDYTTKEPGRFLLIEKNVPQRISKPIGNLYGITSDGAGGWIGTDFASGRVLHVSEKSEPRELLRISPGVGGVEYVPSRKILVVPEVTENRISAYDLSDVLK
jgi:hypothetical protein